MQKETLRDLSSFLVVAKDRSFTKAAAKLGVSRSALSHTIRELEERLGLQLLTRSTRSVSPTLAGERLVAAVAHRFEEIDLELQQLGELRMSPAGAIRVTTHEHALATILTPALARFLPKYPEISVEVAVDYGLTDIVAERFDAGIRSGGQVAKDMIAVRVGPDLRMAVVGSSRYFARHPVPKKPQDLTTHNCINLRLPTHGALSLWEFQKGGKDLRVRVEGQFIVNGTPAKLSAALAGLGLAYVPEDLVQPHVAGGRLKQVLADWCQPYSGYHLYYASRRQSSPAFKLLVDELRYKG
jgi:DNA-binding transcriptional LysR family regulator